MKARHDGLTTRQLVVAIPACLLFALFCALAFGAEAQGYAPGAPCPTTRPKPCPSLNVAHWCYPASSVCPSPTPVPTVAPTPVPTPAPPNPTPTATPGPGPTPWPTPGASEPSEPLATTFTLRGTFSHSAAGYLMKAGKVQTILVCDGLVSACREHVLVERPSPPPAAFSREAVIAIAAAMTDEPSTGNDGCWTDVGCTGKYDGVCMGPCDLTKEPLYLKRPNRKEDAHGIP